MTALALAGLALYGAGLTSTLSPCVLPLVPGYLGVLSGGHSDGSGGGAADDAGGGAGRAPRRAIPIAVFAVGAAATFVALGGAVAAVGLRVGAVIDWSQRLAGVGLVGLGVLMVLGRRGRLAAELRLVRRLPAQPHLRALLLGVGCGAAWTPCVGPLLGVALTAAGGAGSVVRGSLLLAAFATGVLTPFLALSLVSLPAPASLAAFGRRLGAVAWLGTVALGGVLAAGWYDAVVQRLSF